MEIQKQISTLLSRDERFCLATVVESSRCSIPPGLKTIIYRNGKMEGDLSGSVIAENVRTEALQAIKDKRKKLVTMADGIRVFLDVLTSNVMIIICGAGHIAVPLAKFARETGFYVIVIDDRPDFAHPSRFPGCEVIAEDFVPTIKNLPINSSTYVVVITRGHEHDAECLLEILRKKNDAAYVGLIGSRRRVRFVVEMLQQQGINKKRLTSLFTPIGLPIGAESPEEIATSILAELICVRKKGADQARLLRKGIGGD